MSTSDDSNIENIKDITFDSKPIIDTISIENALAQKIKQEVDVALELAEKELKEKYSAKKGKDIKLVLTCTACTQDFIIKRKNNKSDDVRVQICPHIIFKEWKVKH